MVEIGLHGISRVHADGTRAVAHLDLLIRSGEFLVLTGPTGCGKTTTLRLIAGLDSPSAGAVTMDGRRVDDLPTRERDVALVTQEAALYPHLDVAGNLSFALRTRRLGPEEVHQRVQAESRALGLHDLLTRRPSSLSAGDRQKAALGRATARLPRVLLLDEPLGKLAPQERARVRSEIRRVHNGLGITTVYITHDQAEAMALADRVAVLDEGVLQQVGPPMELYHRPRNLFVATFVGIPPMAVVPGRLDTNGTDGWFEVGTQRLRLTRNQRRALQPHTGRRLLMGVRAEHLTATDDDRSADDRLRLVVRHAEHLGATTLVSGDPEGTRAPASGGLGTTHAAPVTVRMPPFSAVRPGDVLTVTVDVPSVHFFDPVTDKAVAEDAATRR